MPEYTETIRIQFPAAWQVPDLALAPVPVTETARYAAHGGGEIVTYRAGIWSMERLTDAAGVENPEESDANPTYIMDALQAWASWWAEQQRATAPNS